MLSDLANGGGAGGDQCEYLHLRFCFLRHRWHRLDLLIQVIKISEGRLDVPDWLGSLFNGWVAFDSFATFCRLKQDFLTRRIFL